MNIATIKNALVEMNIPAYLAKTSSLGHDFVDVAVGSAIGADVLSDVRFTTLNVPCAKSFDSRGYIQHIVLA